ncbi:MAG: hypothetical protein Q8O64_20705 [Sideroxyarcus sp.]|nr:hypothetical protein [Sideroxyarcus sp.]
MNSPALLIVGVLKALVEIAAFSLLAQAIVGAMAGQARQMNVVYRLFHSITLPVVRFARKLSPRLIADPYMGLVAFLLLFWCWVLLLYAKAYVCHVQHLACFAAP